MAKQPRALDHFVLPVEDLAVARRRYESLGFTVAPDAQHPFGTCNCCVFLEDGTFLEPLAVCDADGYRAALGDGNGFVGNDARFRAAVGDTGFSQIVLQTVDALADDETFLDEGISGGPVLDFGRKFARPDGSTGEVAFRLAFASPDDDACSAGFFACQVVKSVPGGRGALTQHRNGALVTVGVIATASDPMEMDDFLQTFLQTESEAGVEVFYPLENSVVRVLTPDIYEEVLGIAAPDAEAFRLAALIVGVDQLDDVRACVTGNAVAHVERPGWLIVPPAPGQGLAIIFQQAASVEGEV